MRKSSRTEKWIAIVAILGIGLIHVVLASGEFTEAPYIPVFRYLRLVAVS